MTLIYSKIIMFNIALLSCTNYFFYSQGSYMTIHITPEPDFSYASFETNVVESSYQDVIERVINVFNPGKFVLTVFSNKVNRLFFCLLETFQKPKFTAMLKIF